jgi:Holliday junction resolvase-like predicted endonuclease
MKRHSKNLGEKYADALKTRDRAEARMKRAIKAWLKADRQMRRLTERLDNMQVTLEKNASS